MPNVVNNFNLALMYAMYEPQWLHIIIRDMFLKEKAVWRRADMKDALLEVKNFCGYIKPLVSQYQEIVSVLDEVISM